MHHRHSLISIHSQTQYSQIPTSHVHKYVKLNTYWPIRKRVHENYNAHAHTGTGEENYSLLRQRERERDSSTHPARKGKAYSSWVRAHGFKSSVTHIHTHRHKDTQSLREREREGETEREWKREFWVVGLPENDVRWGDVSDGDTEEAVVEREREQ